MEVADSEAVPGPDGEYRNGGSCTFPALSVHLAGIGHCLKAFALLHGEGASGECRLVERSIGRHIGPRIRKLQPCRQVLRREACLSGDAAVLPFSPQEVSADAYLVMVGSVNDFLRRPCPDFGSPYSALSITHCNAFVSQCEDDFLSP